MLESNPSPDSSSINRQESAISKLVRKFDELAAKETPQAKKSEGKIDSASTVVKTGEGDTPKKPIPEPGRKLAEMKAKFEETPKAENLKMREVAKSTAVFSAHLPKMVQAEKPLALKEGSPAERMSKMEKEVGGLTVKKLRADMNIFGSKPENFYDHAFSCSCELLKLKKEAKAAGSREFDERIKTLEDKLSGLHVPKASQLAKAFGSEVLERPLSETMKRVDSQNLPSEALKRDKTLFSCKSDYEVKCMYLQRMAKAERTGYSFSLVSSVEGTWQEFEKQTVRKPLTKELEGHIVSFIPKDKMVLVKESVVDDSSTFKTVFKVTDYLQTQKASERGKLALLQIKETVTSQVGFYKEQDLNKSKEEPLIGSKGKTKERTEEVSQTAVEKTGSQAQTIEEDSDSEEATMQENTIRTSVEKTATERTGFTAGEQEDSGTIVEDDEATHREATIQTGIEIATMDINEQTSSGTIVEQSTKKKVSTGKLEGMDVENIKLEVPVVAVEKTPEEEMKKELGFIKELEGQPNIWITRKVVTVDGSLGVLQDLAGFSVTPIGSDKPDTVVTLKQMSALYKAGKLTYPDQIAYFKMLRGALRGVKSQHDVGIINRDVKLANTLCSKDGIGYATDFGTCCHDKVPDLGSKNANAMKPDPEKRKVNGTPECASPEQLEWPGDPEKWKELGPSVDVWGAGMMLWEGLSGLGVADHFSNMGKDVIIRKKQLLSNERSKDFYTSDFGYPEPIDKESIAHVTWECLQIDPSSRTSMQPVLEKYDAWLDKTEGLLLQRYQEDQELSAKGLNPQPRPTPSELYGELPMTQEEKQEEIDGLFKETIDEFTSNEVNNFIAKFVLLSKEARQDLVKNLDAVPLNERKEALERWYSEK